MKDNKSMNDNDDKKKGIDIKHFNVDNDSEYCSESNN